MRLALFAATALSLALAVGAQAKPGPATPEQVAEAALRAAPVFDGHNDVPEQLRDRRKDVLGDFDFTDTSGTADPAKGVAAMQTDLKRMRKGHVGAQFWSVFVPATLAPVDAVTASGSGVDPDISVANARIQVVPLDESGKARARFTVQSDRDGYFDIPSLETGRRYQLTASVRRGDQMWTGRATATAPDVREAAPWLARLIDLLPSLELVVLMGKRAQQGWDTYRDSHRVPRGLDVLATPHPSPLALNGRPHRRDEISDALRRAATLT